MKTKPMKHQTQGCKRLASAEIFAMGAEQGTGKTWMLLADAEKRWLAKEIDAALVIAPNGVHVNWIRREIPAHLSAPCTATFWLSGPTKRQIALLQKQLTIAADKDAPRKLHIHAMNIDAVNTKGGLAHARAFIKAFPTGKVIIIVDESHCIKNPNAKRTQRVIALGELARVRRISSGTLVANSPIDLFSQYEFLQTGLLGTRSYRAFVSEYAELLPYHSPLVQDIIRRTGARSAPQVIARNADGSPRFRNLDKLSALMAPHTFRVLKDDCLDLPAKIYETRFFVLGDEQRKAYEHIVKERNWLKADGEIDTFSALTVINKLRQITSGFILVDGEPTTLAHSGPRLALLKETIEESPGSMIIWASFREELKQITAMLRAAGEEVREYHGGTSPADRFIAIDDFQAHRARFFVANPAAAGTGLTLTAAETAIYYSSSFSLVERSQSEDRCHRKGTTKHVVYIDLCARDTIDERIAATLQAKKGVAAQIMAGL
jgi:SNF2 family DNA or RNA helicase